ncbi:caspase-3-like [Euwallacea fornicatus]|uniref:caspase-3-like n=1 Tax=Euwallacea fornicatus TaxID=995702 RepID=UPI0033900051
MFSKFKNKNKKEKKMDSSVSGETSSYWESANVQKNKNGTEITSFSRQESTISSSIQTSQHTSHTVTHSISAASFPDLPENNLIGKDRSRTMLNFDDHNLVIRKPIGATSIFDRTNRPLNDASMFVYEPNSYASVRNQNQRRASHLATTNNYFTRINPTDVSLGPRSSWNPITSPILPSSTSRAINNFSARSVTNTANTNNESIVPTYKHSCAKLGKALIINNVKFMDGKEERQGAEKDSRDLENLFRKLNFEVTLKVNLKGKAISSALKDFSKSSFDKHDISVVVLMSHGNNYTQDGGKLTKVRGGFTQVLGIDNVPVSADDVIDFFTVGSYHQSLRGKPKIFIFQCCRGEKDQEVRHDAAPIKNQVKEYSDVLIAFSTLPGYLSNRNPIHGTWYIQSLCQVFQRHYQQYHIEDMLKLVDKELSNKHPNWTQTSTYENRGFKACYLHKN